MTTFFGFAIADGMFAGGVVLTRRVLDAAGAKAAIAKAVEAGTFVSAINASHTPTVEAMRLRFGIDVEVPATAPKITMTVGDSFVVMSVRGLGRLEGRTQYTEEEVASATFAFAEWKAVGKTVFPELIGGEGEFLVVR